MQVIPLQPVANQIITPVVNGQNCQFNVYQKNTGLFIDILVNNTLILGGILARNMTLLVMTPYLGFVGDLIFMDTQGSNDPVYEGLGSRYLLMYVAPSEIPTSSVYN